MNLDKYPYLKSYVESYKRGECKAGCITDLTYFFKKFCINYDLDEAELFGWDEDMAEDFNSWGHNSRWANVFEPFLAENLDDCLNIAVVLVEEYGDRDIFEDVCYN